MLKHMIQSPSGLRLSLVKGIVWILALENGSYPGPRAQTAVLFIEDAWLPSLINISVIIFTADTHQTHHQTGYYNRPHASPSAEAWGL